MRSIFSGRMIKRKKFRSDEVLSGFVEGKKRQEDKRAGGSSFYR